MAKQSKLTKAARDQECTLRIYPYCNGNPETTVFAHAPSSTKGMGIKSEDWWGADSCSTCHDIVDGRMKVDLDQSVIDKQFLNGIHETIRRRIEKGLISVKA